MQDSNNKKNGKLTSINYSKLSIHTWVKDTKFRFINCSESVSELAGEDSPFSMKARDDFSLVWRNDAEFFRKKDAQVLKGDIKYINVNEVIDAVTDGSIKKQRILITKIPLFNRNGKCIGIAGSHIILPSDCEAVPNTNLDNQGRLWLPGELQAEYLTKNEVKVLKYILFGKTSKEIAKIIGISYRTVDEYTEKIKRKLQCSSKYEIHEVAIEYGITHIL